jgi:hypothetical protein
VATERMFAELSILETIALVSQVLHQYENAGGFAPPPRWRQRKRFLRRPRSARNQSQMRSRHRRLVRARRLLSPNRQKQLKPQPPLQ